MFSGSQSPPGFELTSTGWKMCAIPTVLRGDVMSTVDWSYDCFVDDRGFCGQKAPFDSPQWGKKPQGTRPAMPLYHLLSRT